MTANKEDGLYTVSPRKRVHFFTPLWRKNRISLIAKFGRKKVGVKNESNEFKSMK